MSVGGISYALALTSAVGMALGFTVAAVERKAPSWPDRWLFYISCGALTVAALGALAAHDYGRAVLCAFTMALASAAFGAAARRGAPSARGVEHTAPERSGPPRAPGPIGARPRGWRRARRRPYH